MFLVVLETLTVHSHPVATSVASWTAGPGGSGVAHELWGLPAQEVPNPPPKAPPGNIGRKLDDLMGWLKWAALAACGVAFVAGIIAFTAGRVVDNRRYGNTGALMMIAAVGGALLFGVGPTLLNSFAGG